MEWKSVESVRNVFGETVHEMREWMCGEIECTESDEGNTKYAKASVKLNENMLRINYFFFK